MYVMVDDIGIEKAKETIGLDSQGKEVYICNLKEVKNFFEV